MLRIHCPLCGLRDESEFTYGGPAHLVRPPLECSDREWTHYLFMRDNPKGAYAERWYHAYGCARWFNLVRDTMSHEIRLVYSMEETAPPQQSRGAA